MAFYPLTGIDKGFEPWGAVFAATFSRIVRVLPREEGAL